MDFDFELYKGKKFSGLMKDIVLNSEEKKDTLEHLIDDLRAMVKTPNEALIIIPLIKDYLDVSIKNDEQLIKLAAIVQRLAAKDSSGESEMLLSPDERKQLMDEANKIKENLVSQLPTK
jgi:hypothetical protein